jgi:hypothetical protein
MDAFNQLDPLYWTKNHFTHDNLLFLSRRKATVSA